MLMGFFSWISSWWNWRILVSEAIAGAIMLAFVSNLWLWNRGGVVWNLISVYVYTMVIFGLCWYAIYQKMDENWRKKNAIQSS